MKRRILLVDDDLAVLLTLKAVLELHGFEVETAGSSAEAFARMESAVYHMVISDLHMETEDAGLEVIRTARRQSLCPRDCPAHRLSSIRRRLARRTLGRKTWSGTSGRRRLDRRKL